MDVWIEIDLAKQAEVLHALRKLGFLKQYGGDAATPVGQSDMGIFFGRLEPAQHEAAAKIPGVRRLCHDGRARPAGGSAAPTPEPQFRSPPNPRRRRRGRRR